MDLNNIIAILLFLGFFGLIFFSKVDKNRLFVLYIIYSAPFIGLLILPGNLGINNFYLITFVFFLFFYRQKKVQLAGKKIYTVLFILLLLSGIFGAFLAESLEIDSLRTTIEFFSTFIFAKILVEECLADKFFFYSVISALKTVLIFALIFLACQFIFGVSFSLSRTQNPNILEDSLIRYPSFFLDPQTFSQFLAGTSFLCLVKDRDSEELPVKNYVLLLLTLVAIFSTGGRGGFGGWLIGFSLIVFFGNAKYRIYALLIGIALFIVVYNFQDSFPLFKRSDDLSDSYDFRFSIWQDAYKIFLNHPIVGIGPGDYANYVSVHNPEQHWMVGNEILYFDHPESGYLKYLVEYGIVGFTALMSFILIPIIKGFLSFLKWRDITFLLLISGIISWVIGFYTVYSLVDIRIRVMVVTLICLLITNYKRFLPDYEEQE